MANSKSRLDGKADLGTGATTGTDISGKHTITPHSKKSHITLWKPNDGVKLVANKGAQDLAKALLVKRRAAKLVKEDSPAGLVE